MLEVSSGVGWTSIQEGCTGYFWFIVARNCVLDKANKREQQSAIVQVSPGV
jgi:hypothetical protein